MFFFGSQNFGPFYEVETGRRDGFVSNVSLADNMPDFRDSIQRLKQKFFDKGLNEKDLVVLSGTLSLYLLSLLMMCTYETCICVYVYLYPMQNQWPCRVGKHFERYEYGRSWLLAFFIRMLGQINSNSDAF